MRRAALAAVLVAGLVPAACTQRQNHGWIEPDAVPATRAELYDRYGVPDVIRVEGDDRWLRYDHAEAEGMTFGARYYALGLVIGRAQSQADRLWIRVDPDDRVTAVEPVVYSDDLRYRLWPFGD
jgi:hypothetical protein